VGQEGYQVLRFFVSSAPLTLLQLLQICKQSADAAKETLRQTETYQKTDIHSPLPPPPLSLPSPPPPPPLPLLPPPPPSPPLELNRSLVRPREATEIPAVVIDECSRFPQRSFDDCPYLPDPIAVKSPELPPLEVEEPIPPVLEQVESYPCLGHRAVLDLGPELFESLEALNGVNGEYVLHIFEQTGTR
jgi:hypothetical protein